MFKVTIKTQQRCINISILLWQHVSILLDHLQANIQRYEVQSMHIIYYGIPYYLPDVHKNSLKLYEIVYIKNRKKLCTGIKFVLVRMEICYINY
jgi:hypothetical protein